MNIADTINGKFVSRLEQARALELPSRQEMLSRAPSVQHFWNTNNELLIQAWAEWEAKTSEHLVLPTDSLLDNKLRDAVSKTWLNPSEEHSVRELWEEAAPGVFTAQFFDPNRVSALREYLTEVANAGIPIRPPYGLVLNRNGAMLDPRSEGYLAAPGFQDFYQLLLDMYMRPVARLLYPEVMGFDTQTFGFSIQWQAGMDTSLRLHTDASAVTMNINMNLPGEEFSGSEIDFYDPTSGKINRLSFEPGTAMIHRGNVAHAAQPITNGKRSNIVLWLYGNGMRVPSQNTKNTVIEAHKRWTIPTDKKDIFAPF